MGFIIITCCNIFKACCNSFVTHINRVFTTCNTYYSFLIIWIIGQMS